VRQYVALDKRVKRDVQYSWLLRGMPIFDELDSQSLDLLADRLQQETFRAGEVVFPEGEAGDKFYIVESGEVTVTRMVDGKPVELSRRGPGEYFGEIALLQDRPRTATITAAKDSSLLSLEGEYFHSLASKFMHLGAAISRTGSRRLTFVQQAENVG